MGCLSCLFTETLGIKSPTVNRSGLQTYPGASTAATAMIEEVTDHRLLDLWQIKGKAIRLFMDASVVIDAKYEINWSSRTFTAKQVMPRKSLFGAVDHIEVVAEER